MVDDKSNSKVASAAEDYALVSVPMEQRKSGYQLSMSPISVSTALVIFAMGGFAVILAGFWVGMIAGLCVAVLGFCLAKLMGNIAFKTGMSSTLTSRYYGFGFKGSALASAIFAFMILGFLALECTLLYRGTLVMFDLDDTLVTRLLIYAVLTILWILLAIFGLKVALRSSALMIVVTLVISVYLVYLIFFGQSVSEFDTVLSFEGIVPGNSWSRLQVAIALIGGAAGTITLVITDFARYCRNKRDVTILAVSGPLFQNVITMFLGALVVVGSLPQIAHYLMMHDPDLSQSAANAAAGTFAMQNTGAYFVIFASWAGFITIYAAQAKAQTINAYSGSLALVNLVDTLFAKKPGRAFMVVIGNLIALGMISADILGQFATWIAYLGCMTMGLCGVMIADFYIVMRDKQFNAGRHVENWNWSGVITLILTSAIGIYLIHTEIFVLGFLITLVLSLVVYPVLRKVLPEGTATDYATSDKVLQEAR